MALLLAESKKLSLESLQKQLVEEIINTDELFSILPFEGHDGTPRYTRELTLPTAAAEAIDATITSTAATFTKVVRDFKSVISDVEIPNLIEATQSNQESQIGVQVRLATKAVADEFKRIFVLGDETANPEEWDGLELLRQDAAFAAQAGSNPGAFSYGMLEELSDLVTNTAGQKVYYMSKRDRRQYKDLQRSLGGTTSDMVALPNVGGNVNVPTFEGIPILVSDSIPTTLGAGNDESVIYCMQLDELQGCTGFFPSRAGMGIKVSNLGEMETKDNTVCA